MDGFMQLVRLVRRKLGDNSSGLPAAGDMRNGEDYEALLLLLLLLNLLLLIQQLLLLLLVLLVSRKNNAHENGRKNGRGSESWWC